MKNLITILIFITLLTPQITFGALTDGLISCWDMDESSGTRADDATLNGNDLTDVNTVGAAAGVINNGANFVKANNENLTITDAAQTGLDITDDISISFWLKLTTEPVGLAYTVIWKGASGDLAYLFAIEENKLWSRTLGNGGEATYTKTTTLGADTLFHIVYSLDISTGTMTFYKDAVSLGTTVDTTNTSITNTSGTIGIGNDNLNTRNMDGIIDEFGIWDRTLSSDEVTELFNSGSGVACPFLAVAAPTGFQWTTIIFQPFINLFSWMFT